MQNQWPDRPKAVGGGGTLVGRGAASRLFWGVGGSNDTIVKNCRRRQSTRDEMEDEVDGDCQDNQVDNAHRRGAKVDRDRHGQFGRDRNDANDDIVA